MGGRSLWRVPTPVDATKLLAAMRHDRSKEYPLTGYAEIGAWFLRMRVVPYVPKKDTIRKWAIKFGLPLAPGVRRPGPGKPPPWTSNLLLTAWLASEGRALGLPRWHPFRQEVESRNRTRRRPLAPRGASS